MHSKSKRSIVDYNDDLARLCNVRTESTSSDLTMQNAYILKPFTLCMNVRRCRYQPVSSWCRRATSGPDGDWQSPSIILLPPLCTSSSSSGSGLPLSSKSFCTSTRMHRHKYRTWFSIVESIVMPIGKQLSVDFIFVNIALYIMSQCLVNLFARQV